MFDEVTDVEWSPQCSTLFSSVGKDGRLELWDLKKNNMLDPFATDGISDGVSDGVSGGVSRGGPAVPVYIEGEVHAVCY